MAYFPEAGGKRLYGSLVVYIPIFHDGSIYEKGGGPRIERSSGNEKLDKAALRIVRRAAPFGKFPEHLLTKDHADVWEVTTSFNFTRVDNGKTSPSQHATQDTK